MAEKVTEGEAAKALAEALGETSETVTITIGREAREITITPLRLRQFVGVLKCVQRLRDAGVVETKTLVSLASSANVEEATKSFDMMKMLLAGGDDIISILSIATDLPIHQLDKLSVPDSVRLASAVFKVNLDFFFQNRAEIEAAIAPAVQAIEAATKTEEKSDGAQTIGLPPSIGSLEQGTD
jgi:hypothetical protein